MEWVLVALLVVSLLLLISVTGRQRSVDARLRADLARVESKLDAVLGHLGVAAPRSTSPGLAPISAGDPTWPSSQSHDPRMDEVLSLVRQNKKIQAIKVYREITGYGLKEAKEAVDRMA